MNRTIISVGGAACKALDLLAEHLRGISLVAVDTSEQTLLTSNENIVKISLSNKNDANSAFSNQIKSYLNNTLNIIVISLSGGLVIDTSKIAANLSKDAGATTIVIAIYPFLGDRFSWLKMNQDIKDLQDISDVLILVNSDVKHINKDQSLLKTFGVVNVRVADFLETLLLSLDFGSDLKTEELPHAFDKKLLYVLGVDEGADLEESVMHSIEDARNTVKKEQMSRIVFFVNSYDAPEAEELNSMSKSLKKRLNIDEIKWVHVPFEEKYPLVYSLIGICRSQKDEDKLAKYQTTSEEKNQFGKQQKENDTQDIIDELTESSIFKRK